MVAVVTTCDPERLKLLPHFVRHYESYGARRFCINLHIDDRFPLDQDEGIVKQANNVLAGVGQTIYSVYRCPFDAMAVRTHHDRVHERIAAQEPWVVTADVDELHEFPDFLTPLTAHLERHAFDYVRGRLVDRMARNGLPELTESESLWKQFPLGTDMTRTVLSGCVDKVMLTKTSLTLMPGHHFLRTRARCMEEVFAVHHFKWDASVIPRLKRRLTEDWKARCGWWEQSARAIEWLEREGEAMLAGIRVFDFADDKQLDEGGPHSGNLIYSNRMQQYPLVQTGSPPCTLSSC